MSLVITLERFFISKVTFKGVRNPEASKKSVESYISESLTQGKVLYEACDTGDMESVRSFAKKVQAKFPRIHLLINNGKLSSCSRV